MKCPAAAEQSRVQKSRWIRLRPRRSRERLMCSLFAAIGHNGQFGRIGSLFALLRRSFHPVIGRARGRKGQFRGNWN